MSTEPIQETAAVSQANASPITDVSYRHYDGPLHSRAARWWTVAMAGIRPALRKWWFWLLVLLASSPYVFWGFLIFLESRFGNEMRQFAFQVPREQRFATFFYRAYDGSFFWIMILALVIAAPTIAADNRTNALQVYLSKPITRLDYLLGKWVSVCLVVTAAVLLPSLTLFLYCMLSFWSEGFFRYEPFLILRVLASALATGAGFASVFVGISAWCRSTMIAAAIAGGVYLASQIIASVLWLVLNFQSIRTGSFGSNTLIQHCSIGGVITGLVWNIYGATVQAPMRRGAAMEVAHLHAPSASIMIATYAALVILGLAAAYVRVRAVEVVAS